MGINNNVDVLLLHPNEEYLLSKVLLNGLQYEVYDPRDMKRTFTKVIVAVIKCIKSRKIRYRALLDIEYLKSIYRDFIGHLYSEEIKKINPKIVLTWIDNSAIFHQCCKNLPEIKFIAIQNGGRHTWCANEVYVIPEDKYYIDDYFCFGEYVKDLFERYNHHIKRYHTVGSLKYGLFYDQGLLSADDCCYDICLISQYKDSQFNNVENLPKRWRNLGQNIVEMTKLVARYAIENKLKVCVAVRSNGESEKEFYMKYFGDSVVFSSSNYENYNSYKVAKKAKLCIALNSTLATEMFGAGHKVLFINPLHEEWLKPVNDGPWYFSGNNYQEFKERISFILEIDNKEYLSLASIEMKYIMNFNPQKLPHKLIRKRINEILAFNDKEFKLV